jgi:hypothetical protein
MFFAAVRLAKEPKNSGMNDNWKTALFLFSRIRGTVFLRSGALPIECLSIGQCEISGTPLPAKGCL